MDGNMQKGLEYWLIRTQERNCLLRCIGSKKKVSEK